MAEIDPGAILRANIAEENGFAKHYEQQQNSLTAGVFAIGGVVVGFHNKLADLPTPIRWLAVIGAAVSIALLLAAVLRAYALSVLSFHAASRCRNEMLRAICEGRDLAELLNVNYRDPKRREIPRTIQWLVRTVPVSGRASFLLPIAAAVVSFCAVWVALLSHTRLA